MAAAKGNTNAEKWTVEKARKLSEKALEAVSDDCYFIASIAEKCDTYRELFFYLMNKFNDDEIVFNTIKRMYNKCEAIIWDKSAKGEMDKTIGIFALKSLHGLMETSRLVTDQNIKTIEQATDKELDDEIKTLKS
jgi:hypothetical protein